MEQQAGEAMLLKGNEAVAHAAVRCGCDGFFGYPITPQSEIIETLCALRPWETTGMVVVQAESELASINMVYAGGAAGKMVMTSSSSPGVALMQEGITYMVGAEIPGLIVNVSRGGPGLGTIQPSQGDYIQSTRGGGNGDYNNIVLAPWSVQEMADFVPLGFELAFKYRNPVIMLSDGAIGQMMERVVLPPAVARRTESEIKEQCPWAAMGRTSDRKPNIFTSLDLDANVMEKRNEGFQAKFREMECAEVRYEEHFTEDAEYLIVAFGSAARISLQAVLDLREQGIKAGLLRPITLWPFPSKRLAELAEKVKGILDVEMNAGQMLLDVNLAVAGRCPISFTGHTGGVISSPDEIVNIANQQWTKLK